MIQPNDSKSYSQWVVLFGMSLLTFLLFWSFTFVLPKPVDDIPLAQGVASTTSVVRSGSGLLTILLPLVVIFVMNLAILMICRSFGFYRVRYIVSCAVISSLGGILLALLPVADTFFWDIIIYFHLKRSDYNIDFLLNGLRSCLAVSTGIGICVGINWLRMLLGKRIS